MSVRPPDQGFQLLLLGGFTARLNGQPVAGMAYNTMRALLAYLAVERPQDHAREVLAELLWSGSDPVTARGNLRRTLSDLRRVLETPGGAPRFAVSKHTIRWVPNGEIDVLDFCAHAPGTPQPGEDAAARHDERQVALYRGEFLAGFSLPQSPDFENWLQLQRETLHRRALALLERLAHHHAQARNYPQALSFALRHAELEPWDEAACRRVMRLYAHNGQHSAALAHYQAWSRLLKTELGALPGDDTRQLAEHLRSGLPQAFLPGAPAAPSVPTPAQLRQVTVVYCELTLAAVDDPDEAMALLCPPQTRCVDAVQRLGGYIVQTHGGGLLAYFGYPQAREDAARQAVQAALAMVREAVPGVDIRAGVHTGLVITGGGSAVPDTVGKTSRLAIQLRQWAGPGEVLISPQTQALVGGYFEGDALELAPDGGAGPALPAYRVRRESGARSRLEAAPRLTPLVGRQEELGTLLGLWAEAARGTPQAVLVQGEAGIGKSRLLLALKDGLAHQAHAVLELRCFPEFSQSPFYPLIEMLTARFALAQQATAAAQWEQLARHLPPDAAQPQAVALLARLLSLPQAEPDPDVTPEKHKEQTLAVLLALLHSLAVQQPVLLIVEDLHWIDPSSLELLTQWVEQPGRRTVLLACTARPDFQPPWRAPRVRTLALAPLGDAEVRAMVASLRADLAADTLGRIVERADGVPLFAEEMAKMAGLDQPSSIPSTLHDLLATRMDRLGAAQPTAQLAATLGRVFDVELLRKVLAGGTGAEAAAALGPHLNALQDAGLVSGASGSQRQFRHALFQEAAYQSQTKAARQAAHRRIAQVLQSDFPQVVRAQPELLAQHLSCAGEVHAAVGSWLQAGQRAAQHCANTEALQHLGAGLELVQTLAPSSQRDRLEFAVRMPLGATLIASQGYGSVEAGAQYTRAATLGEALGDRAGVCQALWGVWLGSSSRVGHRHALELAGQLLHLAAQGDDPVAHLQAHYAMGNSLLWTGQLAQARVHHEQCMALYQPDHHATLVRELGENLCVSSGAHLSWVLWLQGYPAQARAVADRTLALARTLHHPYSQCYASAHVMVLTRWLRQVEATERLTQEVLGLARQHGFPLWLLSGLCVQGWVLAMQGQAGGIAQIRQGVHTVRTAMSGIEAFFLTLLSDTCLQAGQWEASLSAAQAALAVVAEKDELFLQSEILRLQGEGLLCVAQPDMAAAEACLRQALAISQRQGARALELRAAMALARLGQRQGRTADARRRLARVYAWFTEGLDTPDLQEARDLLQALG